MKRIRCAVALAVLAVLAGSGSATADPPAATTFVAHLSGGEEVPALDTDATGQAVFHLSDDGAMLDFRLIVANIENVVASHIHLSAAGVNGPVVASLFGPADPGGGQVAGVIGQGTITASDLVGPLAGSATLETLVAAMRDRIAYVNVHTNDGVPPAGTGPGDVPTGEIRGQIRAAGPR